MYLALPGFSLSSILSNIPQLNSVGTSPSPIIIDLYDWERLRGAIITRPNDYQAQRLGMMFNQLYHQGRVKVVDYQKYYAPKVHQENIYQTRNLLKSIPEHESQNVAKATAEGFISYGLGRYQESLRRSLNNYDRFSDRRTIVENQKEAIKRGTYDPDHWNERVINQYLAALEVRRTLESEWGCDIVCIGQQESRPINALLANHPNKQPWTLRQSSGQLSDHFFEFDIEDTKKNREVADQISTIAQEVAGIENSHWFMFGPRLAQLQSGDAYDRARSHLRFGSIESIVSEAKELLEELQEHRRDNKSVEFLAAEAEWLAEENNLTNSDKQRLFEQLRAETALSNFSRDLDDISASYTDGAKIVVESIAMDPLHQYSTSEIYQETVDLLQMLDPVSLSEEQLTTFMHRGAFRRGEDEWDWYQDPQQKASAL